MSLIPWKNKNAEASQKTLAKQHAVAEMHGELDRIFDRFFRDPWGMLPEGFGWQEGWNPALDVTENEKEVLVRAEIPGVDPKDLNITLANQVLTIEGEKKSAHEHKDGHVYRSESSFGSFRRSVALPAPVDEETVAAEHAHGVVTVRLAKSQEHAPRRIQVRAN